MCILVKWKGLKVNRTIMNECSLRSDQLPVNEVNTDGQLNSKTVELVHDNKHSSSETFDDDDDYPKDNSIPPYCIAGRHPMFGLWEGQFTIKTLTGYIPLAFYLQR